MSGAVSVVGVPIAGGSQGTNAGQQSQSAATPGGGNGNYSHHGSLHRQIRYVHCFPYVSVASIKCHQKSETGYLHSFAFSRGALFFLSGSLNK